MNNGTPFMTFVLGGLVVAVLAIGFFMYSGAGHSSGPTTVINRTVAVVPHPEHHWWQFTRDDHHGR